MKFMTSMDTKFANNDCDRKAKNVIALHIRNLEGICLTIL